MTIKDKRIQLLETAERLFALRGFEGTSVRDIAEEAGANIAMISYYFGSKEKLMQALFEQRTGNIKMRVESLLKDNTLTPIQKVDMLIEEHVERAMHNQKFQKIMICEQIINKNPAIIEMLREIKLKNAALIGELIKDGQKKGAFKKKVDIVMLLSTMVGTVTQLMIGHSFYREFNGLNEMPDEEFQKHLKTKVTNHIKKIFKALLINES